MVKSILSLLKIVFNGEWINSLIDDSYERKLDDADLLWLLEDNVTLRNQGIYLNNKKVGVVLTKDRLLLFYQYSDIDTHLAQYIIRKLKENSQ